jgi:hypothetical protein
MTAQTAQNVASKYPAYDDDGNLMPGFELNEEGDPVYTGPALGGDRGIGTYGQSVDVLVSSGLVKSSALNLIKTGISPDLVLKSVASWTGQYGVNGIGDYLNSKTLQNIVQVGSMAAAFLGLTNSGVIQGNESSKVIATLVQPATEYGVSSVVQWVDGFADSQDIANLSISARQGQYAIDFVEFYGEEINLIDTPADGTTAQRDVIDQAIADIIDNPKVPSPQYTDIPTEIVDDAETLIQADGSLIKVAKPLTTNEDGVVRFSQGSNQG